MSEFSDRITAVIDDHWPLDGGNRCDCGWSTFEHEGGHARHVAEAVEAVIPVARIREAYEFYLLDSDRSAGEIFAQQVGQILSDNQEDT